MEYDSKALYRAIEDEIKQLDAEIKVCAENAKTYYVQRDLANIKRVGLLEELKKRKNDAVRF